MMGLYFIQFFRSNDKLQDMYVSQLIVQFCYLKCAHIWVHPQETMLMIITTTLKFCNE